MRLGLALRAFWKALFDRAAAERMAVALDAIGEARIESTAAPAQESKPDAAVKPQVAAKPQVTPKPVAGQNPAITLLATLQRDARLIDLIHEDLDQYQDAQVGAAARPCLKQCRQSLDRILKIEKLVAANENESVTVAADASAARYRWIGESPASDSTTAKLVHPGWQATSIELPQWSGRDEDATVIAPAQVSAS
jgi:hypothetical protein